MPDGTLPTPSDTGFVAILLLTRFRSGPKLVFHYPLEPQLISRAQQAQRFDTDDSSSDTDDDNVSRDRKNVRTSAKTDGNEDGHANGRLGSESVFGHSVDSLEKLLSPGRWCDSKKFEINVDGLTFVGHPVYSLEDGAWTVKEKSAKEITKAKDTTDRQCADYHMYLTPGSLNNTPPDPDHLRNAERDFTHMPDSFDSQTIDKLGTSVDSHATVSSGGQATEQMSLFHVVFVLTARDYRSQRRAQAMYNDLAKVLSRALHYCQKQANYVSNESRRLLALRMKAKQNRWPSTELWKQMIETSELAWALREIFDHVSTGSVAAIRLNGMEMSLHVNELDDANSDDSTNKLDPLSALLLLERKETLLKEVSNPDAAPLAHFIREHMATKSLQKNANRLGVPVKDVLFLAQHLLKWRKARLIAPLHQRNTYVVSPNAPLDQLAKLVKDYVRAFPTLPSLPNMLKVLSGKPIKYGLLVPSRDHRVAYMDILSFLVRHQLVVQLKTYGWLRLPKDLAKQTRPPGIDPKKRPVSVRALLSPHLRPMEDDLESVSSEKTAIAAPTIKNMKRSGQELAATSAGASTFVIITDPARPSVEQSHLIEALRDRLEDQEMAEHFTSFLHHLDGDHAFEDIAARLGIKRVKVEGWLTDLEMRGWLMSVRYI